MLNASLRRFLRERQALEDSVADSLEAQWNYQGWWVKQFRVAYPTQWGEILASANVPAPLTLRANVRKASREHVLEAFDAAGIDATVSGESGIVVTPPSLSCNCRGSKRVGGRCKMPVRNWPRPCWACVTGCES
jgi:16S rRNA (cytosine967-C5)-methyltransferase